jgi:hypothetical protein
MLNKIKHEVNLRLLLNQYYLTPQVKKIKHSRLLKRQFKKTLLATWLASLNNGEWMLEAYQQVAGIHHYYPAELVRKGFILGSRPVFSQP